jgi:proteasome lid subunit RPN8/RPN11
MKYNLRVNIKQLVELKTYGDSSPDREVIMLLLGHRYDRKSAILGSMHRILNVSTNSKKWDYVPDHDQFLKVLERTTHCKPDCGLDFLGVYHTHPYNRPIPSQMDIDGAGFEGFYLIYSPMYNDLASYYNEGSVEKTGAFFKNKRGFGPANLILR